MSLIRTTDSDYRICLLSFDTLVDLQRDAEARGWSTRWSSEAALRSQVKHDSAVLLQTFLRQSWGPRGEACRCLVMFLASSEDLTGGLATIDVHPGRLTTLERVDRDSDVREALSTAFKLVIGKIELVTKA